MTRTRASVAPWAESVVGAPYPATLQDLDDLPEDGWFYELVAGRIVRMAPAGGGHGTLGGRLTVAVGLHVRLHHLGEVLLAETGFILTLPGEVKPTELAPDVAFVRAERLPSQDSSAWDAVWRLAPDLVVEIASPRQRRDALADKARLWLRHGVRLVWVVWPRSRQVDVWLPGHDEPVQTLKIGDSLDGLDVLPGFAYPLADLFA